MGSKYRDLLLTEYGDTSFVSFIKWLVSKIDKVGFSYEIPWRSRCKSYRWYDTFISAEEWSMWRKTFVRHRITVPYKFPLGAITSMVKPFDCDDLKKYPTPGVTTVQYLTTSLQSLKLLGRTLGLKYNHKLLHKSIILSPAIIQSILYQVHSSAGQRHICPRYSWQHLIREWNLVQNVASYDWSNIFLLYSD